MTHLRPKAEPIAWANVAALLVAVLVDHGWVDDPTARLLTYLLPLLLANLWARFQVYAPDTVEEIIAETAAAVAASEARERGIG